MAIVREIEIDGRPVKFRASAAIPRMYRNKFGRDIYRDLARLQKAMEGADSENSTLDNFSLEIFESLAWLSAKHADPDNVHDDPDEWLDQFNTFSIYEILPQIIELWGLNVEQQVNAKKNLQSPTGK